MGEVLLIVGFYLFAGVMSSLGTAKMWNDIYRHDFPLSYKEGARPYDMLTFNVIGWPVVVMFCVIFWVSLPERYRK